jgi:hypothetical protein
VFCSSTLLEKDLPDYPGDPNATFRAAAEIYGGDHPVVPAVRDPAASLSSYRAAGLSMRDSFVQHPDRELCDWNIQSKFSYLLRQAKPVAKRTTDDQISIDIRKWKREGLLSEGKGPWYWLNDEGKEVGSISVEAQPSRIVLRYCATEPGGKSEEIEDQISLDQTNGGPG